MIEHSIKDIIKVIDGDTFMRICLLRGEKERKFCFGLLECNVKFAEEYFWNQRLFSKGNQFNFYTKDFYSESFFFHEHGVRQ